MRPTRSAAGLLLLGLLLSACADDPTAQTSGQGSPTSTSATASPSGSPSPTISESESPAPDWPTTDRDQQLQGAGAAAVLRAIRTGGHDTFDRVVFEFRRPVGGYHVGYVAKVTEDPSDRPVPLEGEAFLQVVIFNATTDNAFQVPPGAHRQYTGPRTVSPDLDQVQQVSVAGDFEATLSFGIGLAAKAGFEVQVLRSPTRLVIDIAHD